MSGRPLRSQSGFSLLEILIVMALLGGMAVIAAGAIKNGLATKKKLDTRLKIESMVFDALRIMSTDVERAFHYQHALYEIDKASMAAQNDNNNPNPNPNEINPANPALQQPPMRLTNMIGKESSVHFTTLNHYRTTANGQESNQIEVGYYLENCKARSTGKQSKCLWRRSSTIIDNDVTRGGDATPLIENVVEFKIQYLSENINLKEWKNEWITDNNGNMDTMNLFPAMVKFSLSIEEKSEKSKLASKFKQTIIATLRTPNNVDPAKRFATSNQQNGGANGPANNGGGAGTNGGGNGGAGGGGDDGPGDDQ